MASYLTLFVMMTGVWCSSPPPVDVDIDKMVGRFYVVYVEHGFASALSMNDTFCQTDDFTKLNETTLSMYTHVNKGSPSVPPNGYLTGTVTETETGSLRVWIVRRSTYIESNLVKVGEDLDSSGVSQYEYFINVEGSFFWVEVKDVETFNQVYKSEIDAFLEEHGFSVFVIPHNSSCNYAEPPADSDEDQQF